MVLEGTSPFLRVEFVSEGDEEIFVLDFGFKVEELSLVEKAIVLHIFYLIYYVR